MIPVLLQENYANLEGEKIRTSTSVVVPWERQSLIGPLDFAVHKANREIGVPRKGRPPKGGRYETVPAVRRGDLSTLNRRR
jgi:hypothetical protein